MRSPRCPLYLRDWRDRLCRDPVCPFGGLARPRLAPGASSLSPVRSACVGRRFVSPFACAFEACSPCAFGGVAGGPDTLSPDKLQSSIRCRRVWVLAGPGLGAPSRTRPPPAAPGACRHDTPSGALAAPLQARLASANLGPGAAGGRGPGGLHCAAAAGCSVCRMARRAARPARRWLGPECQAGLADAAHGGGGGQPAGHRGRLADPASRWQRGGCGGGCADGVDTGGTAVQRHRRWRVSAALGRPGAAGLGRP